MIYIDVKGEILNSNTHALMNVFGMGELDFSLQNIKDAFERSPEDNDVTMNLNSIGGDMLEGFAIYDYLRTSGRNIYSNIIGECSSIATVIHLAAPKANRSANKHATSVLHFGSTGAWGKAEDLERQAEMLRDANEKMIAIYIERTGSSRQDLEAIMKEDARQDTDTLLKLGFISSVNDYNTARYMVSRSEALYERKLAAMSERQQQNNNNFINNLFKLFN